MRNTQVAIITLVSAGILAVALMILLVAIIGGGGAQKPGTTTGQPVLDGSTGEATGLAPEAGTKPDSDPTDPSSTTAPSGNGSGGTGLLPGANTGTGNTQQGGTQQGTQGGDQPVIEVEKPTTGGEDPDGEEDVPPVTEKPDDGETETTGPSQGSDTTEPSEESKPQTPPQYADDDPDAEIDADDLFRGAK